MQTPHQAGKRLLLVDDEVTLRMVISEALSDAGYLAGQIKNILDNKGDKAA